MISRAMQLTMRRAMFVLAGFGMAATPVMAQVERVDPDAAYDQPIDGDLDRPYPAPDEASQEAPGDAPIYSDDAGDAETARSGPIAPEWSDPDDAASTSETGVAQADPVQADAADRTTYREDDLIGAAQGVFGDGAREVAELIQRLLADQGEPNAYIVGREASGAFVVGARYGSGTLYHKVEGERPVYWTGPSVGFDAGANAGSTFVLVYNLYDSEELYERYPAGEGQLYAIGGVTASYLRKGDVVLIPIRMGAGLRLGINAGYMRFSKKQRWLPF